MNFIGIISNSDDFNYINNRIESKELEIELININKQNINNLKNVKFETVVICNDIKDLKCKKYFVDNIIQNADYLLINTDINVNNKIFQNNALKIITYGTNQKATVTTSSVKEDEMLICIQRNIKNINNKIIEMQEFKVIDQDIDNKKVYNLLISFILEKLYK